MTSSSGVSTRVFGYSKVKWLIENFSLQIDLTQDITSPDFPVNGSEETRWRMNIGVKLMKQKKFVFLSLIRSAIDSGPKHVWLDLKACFIRSNGKCICHDFPLLSMNKGSKHEVFLGSIAKLISETHRSSDLLTIVCQMIVYKDCNLGSGGLEECNHEGFKLLSENMLHLYKTAVNFDTKLVFKNNYILAHKAILCARNRFLNSLIEEDGEDDELEDYTVIDLSELDYKGMDKILSYLYTGDIRHVLQKPSYAIYDCASYLKISEIEIIYKPDELTIKSSIGFQERTYILRGYAFENSRLTWQFNSEGSEKIYSLLFYPKRQRNEYITLFTETFEKLVHASLKFDFANQNGHLGSLSDVVLPESSVDLDDVIKETFKIRQCYQFMEVVINLKLTTGKVSHIDQNCNAYVNGNFYEYFSADMESLLDGDFFTDVLIHNNGAHFWVHRCILASRCKWFSKILANEEENVVVSDIEPYIISILLTYIYAGYLTDVDDDEDIIEVYKAAAQSDLPHLKSLCSDSLKFSSKINRDIRCRVVKIAEDYKDSSLMEAVLNHLFDKKDEVLIPMQSPFSFRDATSCRYC